LSLLPVYGHCAVTDVVGFAVVVIVVPPVKKKRVKDLRGAAKG